MKIAKGVRLAAGSHEEAGPEMCVNEMVAWFEGEPHSDTPECECCVIGAFVMKMNDMLPDRERQRLIPYIPRLAGTRSTPEIESCRADYLAWRATTFIAVFAVWAAGLREHIEALRLCPNDRKEALVRLAMADQAAAAVMVTATAGPERIRVRVATRVIDLASRAWNTRREGGFRSYLAGSAAQEILCILPLSVKPAFVKELFATLDGVLAIGESRGFSRPLPAPGAPARELQMVKVNTG